jgi:hypothetical protein
MLSYEMQDAPPQPQKQFYLTSELDDALLPLHDRLAVNYSC